MSDDLTLKMRKFHIVFRDHERYEDVSLSAMQTNETQDFMAFVTLEGADYTCVQYAKELIFSITEGKQA